jgi:hypothetical protein
MMAESNEPLETPAQRATSDVPPLRIHHFLIWTALTAAIISGCMTFDRWLRNGPPIENPVVIAGLVLGAVTIAGALTCFGCGILWRRRGYAFPASPGDWLLTIMAVSVVAFCGALAPFLAIFFVFGNDDWFALYYTVAGLSGLIGLAWMQFAAIKRHADSAMWRTTFGVMTFIVLLLNPFTIGIRHIFGAFEFAVIACVLWAAWSDWHRSIQRQWTHWCGALFTVSLYISLLCVFGF